MQQPLSFFWGTRCEDSETETPRCGGAVVRCGGDGDGGADQGLFETPLRAEQLVKGQSREELAKTRVMEEGRVWGRAARLGFFNCLSNAHVGMRKGTRIPSMPLAVPAAYRQASQRVAERGSA